MAYTKNTNFTAKDALASGNPSKIIKGSELDSEFDEIATEDALSAKLADNNVMTGDNTFSGISTFSGTIAGASPLVFEGATADAFETTFAITDPTADRTITFPDASGTVSFTGIPVGTVFAFASDTPPTGALALPLTATDINRTTYAALFAVIGTTWGVGDGSTTFGMPFLIEGHVPVQADANTGSATSGSVISHTHAQASNTMLDNTSAPSTGGSFNGSTSKGGNTQSAGGTYNEAAGNKMQYCIQYQ